MAYSYKKPYIKAAIQKQRKMTFPLKLFIAVAVWLVFYLATFRGCQDELCFACSPPAEELSIADTINSELALPLYFKWSDPEAYVGEGIEALVQQTIREGDTAQLLQITGLYFEEEPVPDGAENLGLARAKEVARLFDGKLADARLQLRARQVAAPANAASKPFAAALFEWVDRDKPTTVDRLEDRVAIRFPAGSADRVYAPAVDTFLIELADQLKASGQKVLLTGHTDNTGSGGQNVQLGQARAEAVKRFLLKAGVPSKQVLTESKGATTPVASNNSAEGRYQNRRVEIRFVQQNEPQND